MATASLTERASHVASWHARRALAAGRRGDDYGFDVHQNKMVDAVEASPYPRLSLMLLVQDVGRNRALVLGVEKPLVQLAISPEAPVIASGL